MNRDMIKLTKTWCASSEDSDQPEYLPSMISLRCELSGYLADREDSDQTEPMLRIDLSILLTTSHMV